jgi:hypothetical protein
MQKHLSIHVFRVGFALLFINFLAAQNNKYLTTIYEFLQRVFVQIVYLHTNTHEIIQEMEINGSSFPLEHQKSF